MKSARLLLAVSILVAWSCLYTANLVSEEMAPDDPQIVLPDVVLEIEDLSVEKVEAEIPLQEQLPVPQRKIPLPEIDELEIVEPPVDLEEPMFDFSIKRPQTLSIGAQANISLGLADQLMSSFSVYSVTDPRFKIMFDHEIQGRLAWKPYGSGFFSSSNELAGFFRSVVAGSQIDLEGLYSRREDGLQGRGADGSYSRIFRSADALASVDMHVSNRLGLSASLALRTTDLSFAGSTRETLTEIAVSPVVAAELDMNEIFAVFLCNYELRTVRANLATVSHRLGVNVSTTVGLPYELRIDGDLGFHLESAEQLKFALPFRVSVSGNVLERVSFSLGGGYDIRQYGVREVLLGDEALGLADTTLGDDMLWVVEAASQARVLKRLYVAGDVSFASHSALLAADPADIKDSLPRPVQQIAAYTLTTSLLARWNITPSVIVRVEYERELLEKAVFSPYDRAWFEIVANEKLGLFGGSASVLLVTGLIDDFQLPVVDLSGFYKVAETVECGLELADLLAPFLTDGIRYGWAYYAEAGFNVAAFVQISF